MTLIVPCVSPTLGRQLADSLFVCKGEYLVEFERI